MTNIELSDVELGAVSGGDFTITVPTPSASTAGKTNTVVGAVAAVMTGPVAAAAYAIGSVQWSAGVDWGQRQCK